MSQFDTNQARDRHWPELLAGYVLGDLSSDDMITVQQYLDHNPDAISEIEQLQSTLALLPLGLEDVSVPADLKSTIMAVAIPAQVSKKATKAPDNSGSILSNQPRQTSTDNNPKPSISWPSIATGLATGLAIAFGLQSFGLQQEMASTRLELARLRQAQEQLAQSDSRYRNSVAVLGQPQSRTLTMTGTGTVSAASGQIVISPQQNRALFVVRNMPQPPTGKVYHIWAIVEGQKVACAQFVPESDGQAMLQLPANRWTTATQIVVTVEPEQTNAQPTGEMVMTGQQI
jgi:anti-sigma-K factor RskA